MRVLGIGHWDKVFLQVSLNHFRRKWATQTTYIWLQLRCREVGVSGIGLKLV